jgi:branched-chain amino acid transport system ATP-binding protein
MRETLLCVRELEAAYGGSQVLFGVSFAIGEGEVVTVIGRNGMGKTTSVRCLTGLRRPLRGEIKFGGERIDAFAPHRIARLGIGLVPEGRHIFPNLSVRENLMMAYADRAGAADPWTLDRVVHFFPRLGERLANGGRQLSGGEQQMLAIGRALMTNPSLLILDEATEGLAPLIREEIWNCLSLLKSRGQSILVVDKNVDHLARICDRHTIIERGKTVWSGTSEELMAEPDLQHRYLGI